MNIRAQKIQQGFTLIELMIVVAIVGVLAAVAYPSYSEHVRKTNRVDAKTALMRFSQMQESYFVQNLSYAQNLTTGADGLGLGTTVTSEEGFYTITMTSKKADDSACAAGETCTKYELIATAGGRQADDDACDAFTINHLGVRKAKTGTTTTVDQGKVCW